VILANIGFNYWCDDLKELADLDLVDMAHLADATPLHGPGCEFPVPPPGYFPVAQPRSAAVLATLGDAHIPAALVSGEGRGSVATLFVPLGTELCEHPTRLRYQELLAPILARWGMLPPAEGLSPDVECRLLVGPAGEQRLILLNHAARDFQRMVRWQGEEYAINIPAKGVTTLSASTPQRGVSNRAIPGDARVGGQRMAVPATKSS
ncbi:MAG TPA: hypothetical protein VGM23_14410, partial [Armatimonadota bacterium]